MRSIQQKGLLADGEPRDSDWIPKLTEKAHGLIANEVDPEMEWGRDWDGRWRTLTFDISAGERKERQRLDTWLKRMRFGHLQGSLWITARPYMDWAGELESLDLDPRSVIFMDGRPLGRLSDELIVERSWDFEEVDKRYQAYLQFLEKNRPDGNGGDVVANFVDWFRRESELWRAVLEEDPLLPKALLPRAYRGMEAYREKQAAVARWKSLLGA